MAKGVGSLTAEIGPIFGRKIKVRFKKKKCLWSIFEIQVLKLMYVHLLFIALMQYHWIGVLLLVFGCEDIDRVGLFDICKWHSTIMT